MATAAAANVVHSSQIPVVENGIARLTVFPNNLREIRREGGYETLKDFVEATKLDAVNYIRLAKIERGQIFPRPEEMLALAEVLKVEPMDLVIDTLEGKFDRVAWARENIKATLKFSGGNREDMRIGAALRVRRRILGIPILSLQAFGLPAATASRIENAERPFERWKPKVQKAVARAFGLRSMNNADKVIDSYEEDGSLAATMAELFSPAALAERQDNNLLSLLRALPGKKAQRMANKLEEQMAASGVSLASAFNVARDDEGQEVNLLSSATSLTVYVGKTKDGLTELVESDEPFTRAMDTPDLAMRLDKSVLGMGLPTTALLVFEEFDRKDVADGMVLGLIHGTTIRVVSARAVGRGYALEQADPHWRSTLTVEAKSRILRLAQIELR